MDVLVLYTPGCPNARLALSRAQTAVKNLGLSAEVRLQSVDSPEESGRLGFRGSPSILAGGVDLFPAPAGGSGVSCRLYPGGQGLEGAPSVEAIEAVLSRQARTAGLN